MAGRQQHVAAENKGIVNYLMFPKFGLREWEGERSGSTNTSTNTFTNGNANIDTNTHPNTNTDTNHFRFPEFGLCEWEVRIDQVLNLKIHLQIQIYKSKNYKFTNLQIYKLTNLQIHIISCSLSLVFAGGRLG